MGERFSEIREAQSDEGWLIREVERLQEEQRNARNAVSALALGHLSVPDAIRELNAGGLRAMDRADAAEHEMREALLDRDVARRTAKRCIDWAVAHGFSLPFGVDHVLADDTSTDDELLDLAKRLEWSRDAAMARAAEDREAMKTLEAELATFRDANERAHQTLSAVMAERDAALARAERAEAEVRRLQQYAPVLPEDIAHTPARTAARRRVPLDGPTAQALEGALTITEQERDAALARADRAEAEVQRLHEVGDHQRRERDAALARLRELAGMLMGDAACIDSGGEELDYARFERLCREALDDPSASGRDVGVLGLLGMRERSVRVCRDLGCTNTATHGPDGEPFVCWEHSGNFPRCE